MREEEHVYQCTWGLMTHNKIGTGRSVKMIKKKIKQQTVL